MENNNFYISFEEIKKVIKSYPQAEQLINNCLSILMDSDYSGEYTDFFNRSLAINTLIHYNILKENSKSDDLPF